MYNVMLISTVLFSGVGSVPPKVLVLGTSEYCHRQNSQVYSETIMPVFQVIPYLKWLGKRM